MIRLVFTLFCNSCHQYCISQQGYAGNYINHYNNKRRKLSEVLVNTEINLSCCYSHLQNELKFYNRGLQLTFFLNFHGAKLTIYVYTFLDLL